MLLEEVHGVSPQPPCAHRGCSQGQPAPHSPTLPSSDRCVLLPSPPLVGPGFRDGSAGSKGASPYSAHQAVSQGLEKGYLFKIFIEAFYRLAGASACIPQGSQAVEAHQTPSQGEKVGPSQEAREALLPPD